MVVLPEGGGIQALLGPTNTGKTHRAVERMLEHPSGMIGLPLRLLAREVYDRVSARLGENAVALVTGEEKRVPSRPRYWVCTVESMPLDLDVAFLAVDEIQLAVHRQRGHTFTDRLLRARGTVETWFLGSDTMRPLVSELLPTASVVGHPRFSRLTHVGSCSVGALPTRTAVVAFSVQDVYALAEQIRARHGGTAVVLGALSPRTRNAQVAMYQAGEVQHMVATDAIGMGLNMDVDRIVFAARHKFDGKEIRPLETAELAQIAGRAGRFTRDGSFGTLNSVPALSPDAVASIENHAFVPVRRIVWRNSALEFSSLDALIGSLRERPRRRCLQLVEQADDFDALVALARMQNVRDRATTPAAIELLWDVCRIPDFRKLLLDTHVQLLAAVFNQLVGPRRRVDEDWMARRIARLDDTEGDIETLMNRIAFIRTWTYITNHERWVPNAEHWQAVTRDVEDRQSEALHQRLTERFVESRSSIAIGRPAGGRRRRRTGRTPTVTVDPDSPFSALADLDVPDPVHEHHDDFAHWVEEIVEASFGAFELRDDGWIHHGERRLARLTRGPDVLHPEVTLVGDSSLGPGAQSRVARRLVAWSRDAVASLLAPLSDLARADVSASVRGIAYQLERGLGSVDAAPAAAQLRALTPDDRQRLEATGVVVGQGAVYLPASLRFEAMRLRGALWAAYFGHEPAPAVPPPGTVSVKVSRSVSVAFWSHIGFVIRGPLAIRADQLERAQAWLRDNAGPEGPLVPPQLGAWLGCRRRQLPSVLRAMGFQLDRDGRPSPSGRSGSNQRRSGPPSSRTREPGGVGSRR